MYKVALAGKVLDHSVARGQRHPRLDADIGRILVLGVPEADIRHLRIADGHIALGLIRSDGDALCHVFEDYSVMVEQVMAKPDDLPILKLIALVGAAHQNL